MVLLHFLKGILPSYGLILAEFPFQKLQYV